MMKAFRENAQHYERHTQKSDDPSDDGEIVKSHRKQCHQGCPEYECDYEFAFGMMLYEVVHVYKFFCKKIFV